MSEMIKRKEIREERTDVKIGGVALPGLVLGFERRKMEMPP